MNIKPGFWESVAITYGALLALASVLWFFPTTISGVSWNWGLEIVLLLSIYTAISWRKVEASEIGVRTFFGRPIDQVGAGPVFIPLGIIELRVVSNLIQQQELPANPEKIYRGNDKDKDGKEVPQGMYAPIRILFGKPEGQPSGPYDQQMVAEVSPVMTYKIVDAVNFIREIGTWERSVEILCDHVVALLNAELSTITPAKALQELDRINHKIEGGIDELLKKWGIDLVSLHLKPFVFSHELNTAVLDIPKAQQEKAAGIIRAEGKKQATILEGEGVGAAKKAELDGETDGRKRMAFELDVPGSAILAAETARAITSNPGQKTIIAGGAGFKDLALIGESLATSFANNKQGA